MTRCIIIGSGADLVGRRLGKKIDSGHFDRVIRVNKPYGDPVDVGARMDVLVTRYASWIQKYFPGPTIGCPKIIINEHVGISESEHLAAASEIGWKHVSAGTLACMWALNRGARQVFALGFGFHPDRGWPTAKSYPDGTPDNNPHYNWPRENRWLENNVTLL